jgi:hypothetical protein
MLQTFRLRMALPPLHCLTALQTRVPTPTANAVIAKQTTGFHLQVYL